MAASVEAMLDPWSAALREGKARMQPLFRPPSVAGSAAFYIDRLLGPERRKTGWMRAEAGGDAGPWRQQAVLGRSVGDGDALRDVVRDASVLAEKRRVTADIMVEFDNKAGEPRPGIIHMITVKMAAPLRSAYYIVPRSPTSKPQLWQLCVTLAIRMRIT